MTRVIGGVARGRRLRTPPGSATRPTSDRVREALFSALVAEFGSFDGLRVLDLYAGSGAVGLEALSRGAAEVVLVEQQPKVCALIEENARVIGLPGVRVLTGSVSAVLARGGGVRADIAFLDPPYPLEEDALAEVLRLLVDQQWLAPDAVVVVERSARSPEPSCPDGLEAWRSKDYGETRLWYFLAEPAAPTPEAPGDSPHP